MLRANFPKGNDTWLFKFIFLLFLFIHLISSSSSYSPLTNCLLQMTCPINHPILHKLNISQVDMFTLEKLSFCLHSNYSLHHSTLLSQTDSSKCCSRPTHDECFIRKYSGENKKNWLSYLGYHLTWRSSLWANFPKGNDTWFFICKKMPFSLDSTSCCSIILFFYCKLSHLNVLFTKFSQFSIHLRFDKGIYSFWNRYRSPLIHLSSSFQSPIPNWLIQMLLWT